VERPATVFPDNAPGSGFSAGEVSATVSLTLLIRTGRSPDYKRGMLTRLWELPQAATGAPEEQIVIGIQEVPASQALEMEKIMPDVGDQSGSANRHTSPWIAGTT